MRMGKAKSRAHEKNIKKSSQNFVRKKAHSFPPLENLRNNKSVNKVSKKKQNQTTSPGSFEAPLSATQQSVPTQTQQQQQSVYKRDTVYPLPTPWYTGPRDRFLLSADENYQRILDSSYRGYALESKASFPEEFHEKFLHSFQSLDEKGIFQFDITQPGGLGTKTAKTFVTRCLIGDSGTTYKYLGLRMFSIPWNQRGEEELLPEAQAIYDLNQELISHTGRLLEERNKPVRGHQYNLTLINRCYPESEIKLKSEPCFGNEKCTVSWHADSSLEHFSSIAVYHATTPVSSTPLPEPREKGKSKKQSSSHPAPQDAGDWKIALRVWPDAEGPTAGKSSKNPKLHELRAVPSVAISLPNQSAYYLLDDFNHHHQHTVLAGSTDRYASTHRVSRKEGHSYQWLQSRCQTILQQNSIKVQYSAKQIRIEQQMLQEIEFEWINQFFVQGSRYHAVHSWWHEPMRQLSEYWIELNKRTLSVISILKSAAVSSNWVTDLNALENKEKKRILKLRKKLEAVEMESYDALAQSLREIQSKRSGWNERNSDAIFLSLPEDCRPIESPLREAYLQQILVSESGDDIFKSQLGSFQESSLGELLALERMVLQWKSDYLMINK